MSSKVNYQIVENLLRDTREMLLPHFGNCEALRHKGNHAAEAVTELDIRAEQTIKEKLASEFPEIGFFGEETGGEMVGKFWVLDPIDATGHFIRGNPFATTMLALIDNDEVIWSGIINIATGKLFVAEKGMGAKKDGKIISVSERKSAYIFLEASTEEEDSFQMHRFITDLGIGWVHTISAGHEFCLIAEGKMEGRVSYKPYGKIYDFAPGSLLVKEAGGIVQNFWSDKYDYKNLSFTALAPNTHLLIHEKLAHFARNFA